MEGILKKNTAKLAFNLPVEAETPGRMIGEHDNLFLKTSGILPAHWFNFFLANKIIDYPSQNPCCLWENKLFAKLYLVVEYTRTALKELDDVTV